MVAIMSDANVDDLIWSLQWHIFWHDEYEAAYQVLAPVKTLQTTLAANEGV